MNTLYGACELSADLTLATLAYSVSVCVSQKIKRGRLLNLLTCLSETKRPTKGGRERQTYTLHYMSRLSSSSSSNVLLLKIQSPERANRTHFSLKDGLGPACLRVSKHQPRALKRHRQRRKERTLLSEAQIIIVPHPPPSSLQLHPKVKEFLRLKRLIQDNKCKKRKKKEGISKTLIPC